jgi:DNA-binding IclR family transcriptional regulator
VVTRIRKSEEEAPVAAKAKQTTYAAPALEKAFEILDLLSAYPQGALVTDMAAALGRSVGELFRIVVVMEQIGYLQRSPVNDRYTVSYKILDLAYRATPAQNLTRAATPEMQQLAAETDQSCHFVVPNGAYGLVIAREENPGMRGFSLRLGAAIDMIRSCSGQVLLAFSSAQRVKRIIAQAATAQGKPVDTDWLEERLAIVRRQGFDRRQSPITHGVTDVSYPVFAFSGEIVGALTIPYMEMIDGSQRVKLDAVDGLLQAAAARISLTLGHHPAT